MTRITTVAVLLTATILLAGCGGDPASQALGGGVTGDPADAALLKALEDAAVDVDEMTQQAMGESTSSMQGDPALTAIGRPSPASVERSVERTVSCPAGGELLVAGMLEGSFDRDTRTLEISGSGSREASGCTFARNDMTLTIDGYTSWEWSRRFVEGMPDGPQTRRYSGDWTATTGDGQTRSCSFDYTVSYDPETRTTSVEGELCDSPLLPRRAWKAPPAA